MKKEQLKDCFDRIRPREELICATLEQIEKAQKKQGRARHPGRASYALAVRLAGAACALLLFAGIGIGLLDRANTADPTNLFGRGKVQEVSQPDEKTEDQLPQNVLTVATPEQMVQLARQGEQSWLVLTAAVDAVYADVNVQGKGYLVLSDLLLVDAATSDDVLLPAMDEDSLLTLSVQVSDELQGTVGSKLCVYLIAVQTEGNVLWQPQSFAYLSEN